MPFFAEQIRKTNVKTPCRVQNGMKGKQKLNSIETETKDVTFSPPAEEPKKPKKKKTAGNLPTVFWCHNDEVARWCIEALNQLGLSVPQDISVVGFDGTSASKEDDNLTTIALPFYAIGHRAVLQLLEYYEHGINDTNRTVYLQTFLISKGTLSYANHSKCK